MDLWTTNEREFRAYVEEHHWDDIDPEVPLLKPSAAEVRIGALTLDLVARNKSGGITLVEFKVKASKDTLAQLLLYPRAFYKLLTLLGAAGESLGMERDLKANTSKKRTYSLFRQGCMYYQALPNMPDALLRPLIERFAQLVCEQPVFRETFGLI